MILVGGYWTNGLIIEYKIISNYIHRLIGDIGWWLLD